MKTIEQLGKEHPNWLRENIDFVGRAVDELNQVRREALLEVPCVKCRKPMGEHAANFETMEFVCRR